MPQTRTANWKSRALLNHFGACPDVVQAVKRAGFAAPTLSAVRMWFFRGSVPSEWLAVLFAVSRVNPVKYLEVKRYLPTPEKAKANL